MTTAPDDFVALILTHGRPNVPTIRGLELSNYTGPWCLVVDDDDEALPEYVERYGDDKVWIFSKDEIVQRMDEGDCFGNRKAVVYARNASFDCASELGYRYFIQLDDDYQTFRWRRNDTLAPATSTPRIRNLNAVWQTMLDWYVTLPDTIATIAMAQGGDFIGGIPDGPVTAKRKAMNSFLCDTRKRFWFPGRVNEDVNAYTELQRRGVGFITTMQVDIDQMPTQQQAGGMTDLYLLEGTYVKSAYTVMRCPSAARISYLADSGKNPRIHHRITWDACAPKIVSPTHKRKAG